jgi:hypothetical protein
MHMADQWYYAQHGQQTGPVSTEELKQLAASGQLQPSEMVWKQGMAAWSPANSVEGLFAGAPGASPPAVPPGLPQPGGHPVAMRITLPNWSPGAWVIVGSVALVLISLFFKWTGVPGLGHLKQMGLDFGGMEIPGASYVSTAGFLNPWIMLTGVFIYPVWMLLAGRPIHLVGGILCGAWGAITALFWILKYTSSAGGTTVSAANWGLYIYLVSCLALIVGVILYKPTGWSLFRGK